MKRLETRIRELERGIVNSEDIPIEVVVLDGTEEENEKKIKEAKLRIEQKKKEYPEYEAFGRSPRVFFIKIVKGSEDLEENSEEASKRLQEED